MNVLVPCLLAQLCLAFGLAGLLWPDKFMPMFEVLMFPWAATYRLIRAHSVAALVVSALIVVTLVTGSV